MASIEAVHSRQILDSRGNPTLEVEGDAGLTGERVGAELMALVARAQAAGLDPELDGLDPELDGLDPELELRAAARRFADEVRERERRHLSRRGDDAAG